MSNIKDYISKLELDNDNIYEKLVLLKRVCKVTKGRRYFSFSAISVIGNRKNIVGYGLGKSNETAIAIRKSVNIAKNQLFRIKLVNSIIPHSFQFKYRSSVVYIKPASIGTGIIASEPIRAVLESLGIKDAITKSKGSNNTYNCIIATLLALLNMRNAFNISRLRNKKIWEIIT